MTREDDFTHLPDGLIDAFGTLELAMQLDLGHTKKLAREDINNVKKCLLQEGYYVQLPPKDPSLLSGNSILTV